MKREYVIATDFSEAQNKSVNFLNKICSKEDKVVLLHVIAKAGFCNPAPTRDEIENNKKAVLRKLQKLSKQINCSTEITLLEGDIVNSIERYTEEKKPEMLVIGRHHNNIIDKWINGSVENRIVRTSRCPVVSC